MEGISQSRGTKVIVVSFDYRRGTMVLRIQTPVKSSQYGRRKSTEQIESIRDDQMLFFISRAFSLVCGTSRENLCSLERYNNKNVH